MQPEAHDRTIARSIIILATAGLGLIAGGAIVLATGAGGGVETEDGTESSPRAAGLAALGPVLMAAGMLVTAVAVGMQGAWRHRRRLLSRIEAIDRGHRELRQSEQRLRLALDAACDGAWEFDVGAGRMWASEQFYRLLGYEPDQMPVDPESYERLVHPEDRAARRAAIEQHLRGESERMVLTHRVRHGNGSWRWMLCRGQVVDRDEQGRAMRIVGIHTDITEPMLSRLALAERYQRLQRQSDHTPAHLYSYDPATRRLVWVNRRAADFCGRSVEALLADADRPLPHEIAPEDVQNVTEARRRLTGSAPEPVVEFTLRIGRHDGQMRWLRFWESIQPAQGEAGDGPGGRDRGPSRPADALIMGAALDVTVQRQAEAAARHTERLAAMGTLAANLAHEVINPIGAILTNAHLLEVYLKTRGGPGADEALEHAHQISETGQRCARMIRNMLQFAQPDQSRIQPQDIERIIDLAVELTESFTADHQATIDKCCQPHLPPVPVNTTEIEQVLINLIHNAALAHGRHIRIRATSTPDRSRVRVAVEDDGKGMDAEQAAHAFDPFYTSRADDGGTGLGLSICHGIITGYRGRMGLESHPGKGTCIWFELPAITGGEEPAD